MGSFRSTPDTVKHTIIKDGLGFTYAASHMCGWRLYMEDACITQCPLSDKKNSLFAVFDGHGGAEVSAYVERHFVEELQGNANYKKGDYEKALRQTFMKMDVMIGSAQGQKQISSIQQQMRKRDNGPKYEQDSHAGCTANVILITPDTIYCANAGDSRAVASINTKTEPLSFDHKPEDKQELDRITKAGGTVSYGRVNGGLNLSRAFGDLQYKKTPNIKAEDQMISANPDIKKIENKNIDFIIMGCDGIWQIKSNAEMVEWMRRRIDNKLSIDKILEELLDELVSKDSGNQYGMDNMSAILIKFDKKA